MVKTKSYIAWSWDAKHEGQVCDMSTYLGHICEIKKASNRQRGLISQTEISL